MCRACMDAVGCIEHFNLQSHVAGHFYLKTQVVRLICDTSEKQKILHACHSDLTSGHLGIKRTIKRIRERFTRKGLNKEVIELVGIGRSICA